MTDVKDMLGFSDDDDDLQSSSSSSSSSSRRGMPPPPHVSHSMRAAGRMPSLDGATKKKVKKGTLALISTYISSTHTVTRPRPWHTSLSVLAQCAL